MPKIKQNCPIEEQFYLDSNRSYDKFKIPAPKLIIMETFNN